jgi:microcystin-dependent protein
MSEQFLGQISIFGFTYAPTGFAPCNGQLLAINQNQALFILLGTTNGGNGTPTFVLPNLQGLVRLRFRAKAGPLAL